MTNKQSIENKEIVESIEWTQIELPFDETTNDETTNKGDKMENNFNLKDIENIDLLENNSIDTEAYYDKTHELINIIIGIILRTYRMKNKLTQAQIASKFRKLSGAHYRQKEAAVVRTSTVLFLIEISEVFDIDGKKLFELIYTTVKNTSDKSNLDLEILEKEILQLLENQNLETEKLIDNNAINAINAAVENKLNLIEHDVDLLKLNLDYLISTLNNEELNIFHLLKRCDTQSKRFVGAIAIIFLVNGLISLSTILYKILFS